MTDLGGSLQTWHRRVAAVVGAMALALVRRSLAPGMLQQWGSELDAVARDMRGTEVELDENKRIG